LQYRQHEGGGLAGAGLRRAEQIATCEDYGNGLRLDGGGYGVTLLGDCAEQLGRKPEILERRFDKNLLMFIRREDLKGLRPFFINRS